MTEHVKARPIKGVHHAAYRCRDAEQTIWFYSDVLGLVDPTGVVIETVPGSGDDDPYLHLFFRMGNGEFLAFFDAPGSADPEWFARKESFDMHWAFEVDSEDDLLAMQERIQSFGVSALGPVDHGFVRSVYMYDPNGIQVELTYRMKDHDAILDNETKKFDTTLAEWSRRTRAMKEAKFGAEAIDRRSRSVAA
ncbi:MAG: VOC family protein [Sphingomonadales bacterium]|jgi:catechol 2,3-dioxygenase-like lactoylglutathione lyase family enzyme|nr:VOC family protein [Sphingomonadales bacterium]MBK9002393.1 VOC family protein [Sphingomonadales bacterium]MBK9267623.1 VOC family protein [Sphingomonadales bacterium]MBP6434808.1 VOC family protein [Sphingorhabdus sp.]